MRRTSYFWGAILILAGGLLMLENLGLLAVSVWQILWPAVIILAGLWFLWGTTIGRRAVPVETYQAPTDGAERLRLAIHYGAGKLRLGPGASSGNAFDGSFRGGVDHKLQRDGTLLDVDLSVPTDDFLDIIPWGTDHGLDWDLRLSESLDIELTVDAGASENTIDLRKLTVSRLTFKTGASDTRIQFSERPANALAEVSLGAASAELTIPVGVAASIRIKSGLTGINVDQRRFPRRGEAYESADFASADHRLTLQIEAGVGSVRIM
jgi:hypothetical protein